jgi:hypothetical protein
MRNSSNTLAITLANFSQVFALRYHGTSVAVKLLPWLKSLERFRDLSSCSDCCASISWDLFVAASFYSLLFCVAAEPSYFSNQMFKWASELQVPGGSHDLDPSEIQSSKIIFVARISCWFLNC